ncbi:MAG: hypothetical protein ACE37F_09610 [Nannocystaceae bacterium]|nr:hypothetical protein [bacterium]
MRESCIALALGMLALGCDSESAQDAEVQATDTSEVEAPRECIAPEGLGRPRSIEQAVDLINALPKPTSLSCFVESLDRPLALAATDSQSSAQPAEGAENARLFITEDPLIMSVLPDGPGSDKLEFAVDVGDGLSIKAELEFPIEAELPYAAPYDEVRRATGTSCGACHLREQVWDTIDDVPIFASEALQHPTERDISPAFVEALAGNCDPGLTARRCEMLTAVFAHGETVAEPLPELIKICRLVE